MKKGPGKRKSLDKKVYVYSFLSILILAGISLGVWFLFFSYSNCSDSTCFSDKLVSCDRAKYLSGDRMILEYKIKGFSGDSCEVEVKLLQGDLNNKDSKKLEGYSMNCFVPKGVVISPESNLKNCHGRLKEAWQELVITRLNDYILDNVGRINLDILEVEI